MDEGSPTLVSRAELARYAGVSRAAVTNWRKRGPDFPEPADSDKELFDLDQVADWLSSRAIPANARHPHESAGTTYADRVRANTGPGVEKDVFRVLDGLRGTFMPEEAALLVATLVFLRSEDDDAWNDLRERARRGDIDGAVFTSDFAHLLPPFVADGFHTLGNDAFTAAVAGVDSIGTRTEDRTTSAAAFEHALSFLTEVGGKRSAEFATPKSLTRMMVRMLASDEPLDSVYDPCCGTGGFLTAAARAQSELNPPKNPRIIGAGLNWRVFGIAHMNTLLHGIDAEFTPPGFPWNQDGERRRVDLVLANPPFNLSHDTSQQDSTDAGFRYGRPPRDNANFAWLQHAISRLTPGGRAGVLMANGASSSASSKEAAIRSGMVEDGAVECVIALPDRLFQHTTIPVTLWILKAPTGGCDGILFIDARKKGRMTSRTARTLQNEDADLIQDIYRTWRSKAPGDTTDTVSDVSRFASIQEIRNRKYSLAPPIYVMGRTSEPDQTEQSARVESLIRHLGFLESQMPRVDTEARHLLQEAQKWMR